MYSRQDEQPSAGRVTNNDMFMNMYIHCDFRAHC